MKKNKSLVYVVIAHGSKNVKSNEAFFEFLKKFRKTYPEKKVEGCFLDCARPNVPETLEKYASSNYSGIVVIPLMFFPGKHVANDIPDMIKKTKAKYPGIDFHYSGALADHPKMLEILADKALLKNSARKRKKK